MANVGELRVRITADASGVETGARKAEQAMSSLTGSFRGVNGAIQTLLGAAGIAGLGSAFATVTGQALAFGKAMAAVETLLPTGSDMQGLADAVLSTSKAFGQGFSAPIQQAGALYEIISAGTSDAAQATAVLTQANKLAVGGFTDIQTAADGLTSVLNSYGAAAGGAENVSDSFFVAAAAGKTTIAELSRSLGLIAPIAAQSGVKLDEVTAAVGALTKGGMQTGVATQGLRQIIASVVKPTKEAADEAKRLGISFNAASLQSLGLAGFMDLVKQKTGGSTSSLALLFGGVEALVPAMALTGTAAGDFANTLELMKNKAGETERAFGIMSQTIDFRWQQLKARIGAGAVAIGKGMLSAIVPAAEAVAESLYGIAQASAVLAAIMAGRLAQSAKIAVTGYVNKMRAAIAAGTATRQAAVQAAFAAKMEAAAAAESTAARARETTATLNSIRATQAAIQVSRAETIAKLRSAQAISAAAARVPISTLAPLGGAAVEREMAKRAAATRAASAATRELAILGQQEARVKVQVAAATSADTAAKNAATAATARLAVATNAQTAAMARMTVASRVASASMTALKGALAFFGGPIGLAVTIALAAWSLGFLNTGRRARAMAAEIEEAAERSRAALNRFSEALQGVDEKTLRLNYTTQAGLLSQAATA
ncbi:phage tail tape measure protein, partial [Longimicrobium sp.]|uniref:phage tail tape measure protein n=1 Tax=Longimicrobium sp. TaxID=2029185 RepID=UPI002F93872D